MNKCLRIKKKHLGAKCQFYMGTFLHMGHHIMKWAKLNFVARLYDSYVPGHKGHNGARKNSTWPISLYGDPIEDHLMLGGEREGWGGQAIPGCGLCVCVIGKVSAIASLLTSNTSS